MSRQYMHACAQLTSTVTATATPSGAQAGTNRKAFRCVEFYPVGAAGKNDGTASVSEAHRGNLRTFGLSVQSPLPESWATAARISSNS